MMAPTGTAWAASLAAGFASACACVGLVRRRALRAGHLDAPNERSSHVRPTPRGGGIGVVFGLGVALAVGWLLRCEFPAWAVGGFMISLAIAWIGWQDDRWGVSVKARLAAQLGLAFAWVAYCAWRSEPTTSIWLAAGLQVPAPWSLVFFVPFIAWMANLHNFMDGIDGIAAAQAGAVGLGAAVIATDSLQFVWLGLTSASLGFLLWNWSPAKIFLGDVGSAFLGFLIAVLAVRWESDRPGAVALICVLDAVFIVDATWTLAVRALARQPLGRAHRSHAYQIAARRLGSHGKVAGVVLAYDLSFLLPLAFLSSSGRLSPVVAFAFGAVPIMGACAWLGAGRLEIVPC